MMQDIETHDNIVDLVWSPLGKVCVEESNPRGKGGKSLNVQTRSGHGGRKIRENRRLATTDIEHGLWA